MTDDEIIAMARKAKSLMHRDELAWLIELARNAPDGPGVEVGVYCGASLIAWSLVRQGRGDSIGVDNWSYRDIANLKITCKENLNLANVAAQMIDLDSAQAAQQVGNDLAFVFIDGDHTSPAIDHDIEIWTPKIKPGGVVVFHDYGRRKNNCNVTATVDHWQSQAKWVELGKVETTIGFRRP